MLKSRIVFFFVMIVLTVVYVGGCRRAGEWLVKDDVPAHADAMVLLMGSFPERVLQVVDLYHEGRADRLIIVEESMGQFQRLEARLLLQMADSADKARGVSIVSNTDQARDAAVRLGIPADRISVLPGDARSTLTEAIVVRKFLEGNTVIDTMILVSSPAHMRRASMIFRAAFRDAEIPYYVGCSPSKYSSFNPDKWWRRKEDIQAVLSEFVKIGSFVIIEKRKM